MKWVIPALPRVLVPRTHVDPDAEGEGGNLRHRFDQKPDSSRKDALPYLRLFKLVIELAAGIFTPAYLTRNLH